MIVVLLVDDNHPLRALFSTALTTAGFLVLEAPDAEIALGLAVEHRIDLLITDSKLGGTTTGAQLAEQVRELHPHARVISVSGYPQWETKVEADVHLLKPFGMDDLIRAARRLTRNVADSDP